MHVSIFQFVILSYFNSNCSNLLDMRNLEEQVKKVFSYQKLIWPFTAWINCSSNLKSFANSLTSASNFKNFSQSLEHTVGQNNFGSKIIYLYLSYMFLVIFCSTNVRIRVISRQEMLEKKGWRLILEIDFSPFGKTSRRSRAVTI